MAKPMDLKSAMQAISNGGSPEVAKVLLQAIKKQEAAQEVEQASGAYDWHGDYVALAVRAGNIPVLKVLLETGWVLKWQQAEVRGARGRTHAGGVPSCVCALRPAGLRLAPRGC